MKKKLRSEFNTRQYMLSKDYEIYYYDDTRHVNVRRHTHEYYEFYVYLEGDVDYEIGDVRYSIREGDCVIVPPGLPHRAFVKDTEKPYRRFVFWISAEYAAALAGRYPDLSFLTKYLQTPGCRYLFHTDTLSFHSIRSKIVQLLEEVHGCGYAREAAIEIRVQDLILLMNRVIREQIAPRNTAGQEKDIYRGVMEYIDQHLNEEVTLNTLSEVFFVSKYYISHTFKEHLGISVHQYLTKKRLSACRDAIVLGESISDVYAANGFKDYTGFFKAFKKEYGISPREYREIYSISKGVPH